MSAMVLDTVTETQRLIHSQKGHPSYSGQHNRLACNGFGMLPKHPKIELKTIQLIDNQSWSGWRDSNPRKENTHLQINDFQCFRGK